MPARDSASTIGAACASVRYSTAMSEKESGPPSVARESTRPESSDRCDTPPTSSSMVRTTKSASSATDPAGYRPTSGASGSSRAGSSRRPGTSVDGAIACTAAARIGAEDR